MAFAEHLIVRLLAEDWKTGPVRRTAAVVSPVW
jgi:hypothetical protein